MLVHEAFPHVQRVKDKEIGIEIEMEGSNLYPKDEDTGFRKKKHFSWNITEDGSLRGESCEYVLASPIVRGDVHKVIGQLVSLHKKNKTIINDSDRCGVHIHINVQDLTVEQTINFILLYLVFEDVLVKFCGEQREGNLFCLRAKDAEYFLDALYKVRREQNLNKMQHDNYRYASVNVSALNKYGTLEFRSFRTPQDLYEIENWINLLLCVKDAAVKVQDPRDIVEGFSKNGELAYMREVFGKYADLIDFPNTPVLMLQGVRRIQEIAYAKVIMKEEIKARLVKDDADNQFLKEIVRQALMKLSVHNKQHGLARVMGHNVYIPPLEAPNRNPIINDISYDININEIIFKNQIDLRPLDQKRENPKVKIVLNLDGTIGYKPKINPDPWFLANHIPVNRLLDDNF